MKVAAETAILEKETVALDKDIVSLDKQIITFDSERNIVRRSQYRDVSSHKKNTK